MKNRFRPAFGSTRKLVKIHTTQICYSLTHIIPTHLWSQKKKEEKRGPQQSVVDPIMHGMACTYIKEISQMESSAPLKYV